VARSQAGRVLSEQPGVEGGNLSSRHVLFVLQGIEQSRRVIREQFPRRQHGLPQEVATIAPHRDTRFE
jgi:hypothetical protein